MDYQNLKVGRARAAIASAVLLTSLLFADARAALPTFTTPEAGHMRAHFVNVGQGSSVLLEFACAAALIDTGGEANDDFNSTTELQKYLDAFFARRPELRKTFSLVLITHAHIDHTRGLPMVLREYSVNTYVDNGAETGSGGRQQKAAHAKIKTGSSHIAWQPISEPQVNVTGGLPINLSVPIPCENNKIQFHALWGGLQEGGGWTSTVFNNQNDSSVVTQLKFGDTSFLFMGDLEGDVQDAMLKDFCPTPPAACPSLSPDVFHMAHHGADTGLNSDLLAALKPKVAVISMGPSTRAGMWTAVAYGHPRQDVVDSWKKIVTQMRPAISAPLATKASAKGEIIAGQFTSETFQNAIYATGWDGTTVIEADSNGKLSGFYTVGHP
jgi:competence protein ComEC